MASFFCLNCPQIESSNVFGAWSVQRIDRISKISMTVSICIFSWFEEVQFEKHNRRNSGADGA
jgi:hypothetical protein